MGPDQRDCGSRKPVGFPARPGSEPEGEVLSAVDETMKGDRPAGGHEAVSEAQLEWDLRSNRGGWKRQAHRASRSVPSSHPHRGDSA
jgi:hypothetical protein